MAKGPCSWHNPKGSYTSLNSMLPVPIVTVTSSREESQPLPSWSAARSLGFNVASCQIAEQLASGSGWVSDISHNAAETPRRVWRKPRHHEGVSSAPGRLYIGCDDVNKALEAEQEAERWHFHPMLWSTSSPQPWHWLRITTPGAEVKKCADASLTSESFSVPQSQMSRPQTWKVREPECWRRFKAAAAGPQ